MSHKIASSLDWSPLETILLNSTSKLMYKRDVQAMIRNIYPLIKELSNAEVLQRRGLSSNVESLLAKINADIEMVEEYIIVAALMGRG